MEQKNWLQRLQESDQRTKTRWLVGLSAVSMAIVVVVWVHYFNALIAPTDQAAVVAGSGGAAGVSFFDTMQAGSAVILDHIWSGLHSLSNILKAPRSYIIKP